MTYKFIINKFRNYDESPRSSKSNKWINSIFRTRSQHRLSIVFVSGELRFGKIFLSLPSKLVSSLYIYIYIHTRPSSPSSEVHPSSREIRIPEEREMRREEDPLRRRTSSSVIFKILGRYFQRMGSCPAAKEREGEGGNRTERAGTDIASRSLFWEQDLRPPSTSSWCSSPYTQTRLCANLHACDRVSPCVSSPFPSHFLSSSR